MSQFVLDYPNEFVTSIKGKSKICGRGETWITSLTFKTSKGRTSPTFGNVFGDDLVDFVLESKGCALVGFYGWCSYGAVFSLGAYSLPMPFIQDAENLEAQSGDEGASSLLCYLVALFNIIFKVFTKSIELQIFTLTIL